MWGEMGARCQCQPCITHRLAPWCSTSSGTPTQHCPTELGFLSPGPKLTLHCALCGKGPTSRAGVVPTVEPPPSLLHEGPRAPAECRVRGSQGSDACAHRAVPEQ